jgi:hypothetical protein
MSPFLYQSSISVYRFPVILKYISPMIDIAVVPKTIAPAIISQSLAQFVG